MTFPQFASLLDFAPIVRQRVRYITMGGIFVRIRTLNFD